MDGYELFFVLFCFFDLRFSLSPVSFLIFIFHSLWSFNKFSIGNRMDGISYAGLMQGGSG